MARYLYSELAQLVNARQSCEKTHNIEWFEKHGAKAYELVREKMPRGCGFDAGTTLDLDSSHPNKLVFVTSYHHMNDCGMYDGWTEHIVTIKPSLAFGFHIRITGSNRNDIKDYIADVFSEALKTEI